MKVGKKGTFHVGLHELGSFGNFPKQQLNYNGQFAHLSNAVNINEKCHGPYTVNV